MTDHLASAILNRQAQPSGASETGAVCVTHIPYRSWLSFWCALLPTVSSASAWLISNCPTGHTPRSGVAHDFTARHGAEYSRPRAAHRRSTASWGKQSVLDQSRLAGVGLERRFY